MWPEIASAKNDNRHELVLSGAQISERIQNGGLDANIFMLTSLNYLNISETCLSVLPENISSLTSMQTLVLHSNKLESLPLSICKLSKLKTLDVSRNKLTALPEGIVELQQLSFLNASSNLIETIPNISKNEKLSILDIANNKIKSISNICTPELVHLAEVKLSKNEIEEIPTNIKDLAALKVFDLSENQIKIVPFELSECNKLKEVNLKNNPIIDKRLVKLIDQCRTKQVIDYIKQHCPKGGSGEGAGKGGKKGKKTSTRKDSEKSDADVAITTITHTLSVLHVNDSVPNVVIEEVVKQIRPYILCCLVTGVHFDETTFKKFIQIQTKLHDSICAKRNAATIATHDFSKLPPGNLIYSAAPPNQLKIQPLMRNKEFTGAQLFAQLQTEAENLRLEKKRNAYSGIHRYLYLLEGKSVYPCLLDSEKRVISFPPITNSDITKMSETTTSVLLEVSSAASQGVCRKVMDALLYEMLLLGIGDNVKDENGVKITNKLHTLTVQQVKIVDLEGNLKTVYPSRTDLIFEDKNITVVRET